MDARARNERRGITARFEQQWRTRGAPFHIQPVCSVGTNDGAKGIGFLSVGQAFDCHLTLASNRDGQRRCGVRDRRGAPPPGGFFEEVETWGDTSWTPDGDQCSKSASKIKEIKERGASTWRPFSSPGTRVPVGGCDPNASNLVETTCCRQRFLKRPAETLEFGWALSATHTAD
jgi:hypothetical protein